MWTILYIDKLLLTNRIKQIKIFIAKRKFPIAPLFLSLIPLISLLLILGSQELVRVRQGQLNSGLSERKLWEFYRRSIDPVRRREAALILASKSMQSPRRLKRLLASQGWGDSPMAAVVLKLQAQNAARIGEINVSKNAWEMLLKRFPYSAASADAYYTLGRERSELREELLLTQPSHPAALASALELFRSEGNFFKAALHLARWGERWYGADNVLRNACASSSLANASVLERKWLAIGLAKLGDSDSALNCLRDKPNDPELLFLIGKSLLQGNEDERKKGEDFLLFLAQRYSNSIETKKALSLLSKPYQFREDFLEKLPQELINNSPSIAAAKVRIKIIKDPQIIFKLWPEHPDIWQLQWDLAREALIKKKWNYAETLLNSISSEKLSTPFASRQLFWLGFTALKQGRNIEAERIWRRLLHSYPSGYYSWRASVRLGEIDALSLKRSNEDDFSYSNLGWDELQSKYSLVNNLWRLGLFKEAWESWRSFHINSSKQEKYDFQEALVEGRLRVAVGDEWTGLRKLREVSLGLIPKDCEKQKVVHLSQYPYRFISEIKKASQETGVAKELLLAVVKQESRFSEAVISNAGAIGLMQLMYQTAQDFSSTSLTHYQLVDPELNLLLGGRYLAHLLESWEENSFLTIASYNAGPRVVSRWISSDLYSDPELWVETIPYPETRFYVKKVLGNFWSYLNLDKDFCSVGN